jgi:hypothetical protein
VEVVASDAAAQLVEESGGRLYVWPKRFRCCGSVTFLRSSTRPSPETAFRIAAVTGRFEVLVPAALAQLPDELHLEVRRFPRRVEAYWNGCAWIA